MGVQLLDLKAQYATIKDEIKSAIGEVLESQHFILGPTVTQFEKHCCDYLSSGYTLGVSSGSDALLLALMALGIKPGDKVITSSFSFFATAGCVARLGAIPVFADIDPISYNISPDAIEAVLIGMTEFERRQVKAIIPVHLYGQMADMSRIMDIADRFGLYVVEDAAQAFGAEMVYGNEIEKAGTIGHIGCFSFFPSKNLGAYGDGGMVCTNDNSLYEKMKILRVHGSSPKYYHSVIGGNFRLDEIQAAVLDVKLKHLDKWSEDRRSIAEKYSSNLEDVSAVIAPEVLRHRYMSHIFHQFVIKVEQRDNLMKYLNDNNIGNAIYYPLPLHMQSCFSGLGYLKGDFPFSEEAASKVLALPIYPELTDCDTVRVIETIRQFYNTRGNNHGVEE